MFMFIPGTCIQHCREPRNISYNCLCLCLFQEPVYNIVGNQEISYKLHDYCLCYNCLCLCLFQEPVYNIVGNQEI